LCTAVPNSTFAYVLGHVLGRPTLIPLSSLVVQAALGEMRRETLLVGQSTKPARLLQSGYSFLFEGIEDSLRFQLGRTTPYSYRMGYT
jgi:NAD dependent epimerase/dehydratase family enzyme